MEYFDISQLSEDNPWWVDPNNILKDIKIESLDNMPYQWDPALRFYFKLENDVLYSLRGPRQVGKTTLLKIIIRDLILRKKVKVENVFYWSFEKNNEKELHQIVKTYLDWRSNDSDNRRYLFFDEVCNVKGWSRELIHFANKGAFRNCSIIVTGSHSMDMKHSTELMPGRRGGVGDEPLDKILVPMKFSEFVPLLMPQLKKRLYDLDLVKTEVRQEKILRMFGCEIDTSIEDLLLHKKELNSLLEVYLLTGGIPSVINEYEMKDQISTNLFNIYLKAMIGDLHRYNYKEIYFKQIIREIFNTLTNPVSWNSFKTNTDVKSHNTIQEYITAMEELYITEVSYRISVHNKRIHTNHKKIYVLDPFIFHALHGWANAKKDYFRNAKANVLNLEMKSKIIEGLVYSHLCRWVYNLNPRDLFDPKDSIFYYRDKSNKEVDFLISFDDNFYPFEVKYQASINSSDFFGFKSFNKGVLITKDKFGLHRNYVQIPVSLFLLLI